ncbi:MAG: type II toxin-antitoxin system Phd/YefM family antitoxin [Treponema sp.]|jgi:antitoxin (DNA-binding transcriptional repressor) of toxin-antitoxin stability system|nr:type II toxin-antitoxin system Phd/YefM family antitoxin [Treponema sp.]
MITVGVKDLKDHLSQYLRYVKNGEKVIITEYNRIIAEITVPEKQDGASTFEQRLMEMVEKGEVILTKTDAPPAPKPKFAEHIDYETILEEVRVDQDDFVH